MSTQLRLLERLSISLKMLVGESSTHKVADESPSQEKKSVIGVVNITVHSVQLRTNLSMSRAVHLPLNSFFKENCHSFMYVMTYGIGRWLGGIDLEARAIPKIEKFEIDVEVGPQILKLY